MVRIPGVAVGVGVGIFALLIFYVSFGTDYSSQTAGGQKKFIPQGGMETPGLRSAASNMSPRLLTGARLPLGATVDGTRAAASPAGVKAAGGEKDKASAKAKNLMEGLGEAQEELSPEEQAQQIAQEAIGGDGAAAGNAEGPGALGGANFGSRGGGTVGGASMGGGGGGGSASAPDARSTRAGGQAPGARGASAAKGAASSRALVAAGPRGGGGVGGRSGPNASSNALASGNASGGTKFNASSGGTAGPTTAAAQAGTTGAGDAVSGIGAQASGPTGTGGGGAGAGGPSGIGAMAGGGASGGGTEDEFSAYAKTVGEFEMQKALVDGRTYILCLIKAFHIRYNAASATMQALTNQLAADKGRYQHYPRMKKAVDDLHREITSETGMNTQLKNASERLGDGEYCFGIDQDGDATQKCYERWTTPITGLRLIQIQLVALNVLVAAEGADAVNHMPCGYMCINRSNAAQSIRGYQNSITSALNSLVDWYKWGDEDKVVDLSRSFVGPYNRAKESLNAITPELLKKKYGSKAEEVAGKFEPAQRNANLNLEKANTEWQNFHKAPTTLDRAIVFIGANRETQYAADSLAQGAVALKLRAGPKSGARASAQFVEVGNEDVKTCDVPRPPPPPDDKK